MLNIYRIAEKPSSDDEIRMCVDRLWGGMKQIFFSTKAIVYNNAISSNNWSKLGIACWRPRTVPDYDMSRKMTGSEKHILWIYQHSRSSVMRFPRVTNSNWYRRISCKLVSRQTVLWVSWHCQAQSQTCHWLTDASSNCCVISNKIIDSNSHRLAELHSKLFKNLV